MTRLQDYVCTTSNGWGGANGCGHHWTGKGGRMPCCPKCGGGPGPRGSVFFDHRRFMDALWKKLTKGEDPRADLDAYCGFGSPATPPPGCGTGEGE